MHKTRSLALRPRFTSLLLLALAGCGATAAPDGAPPHQDSALVADTRPPVVTNLAAAPTADGAVITWTTDEPADSQVQWGTTASYGRFSNYDAARVTSHRMTLTGLVAGTYHFRAWTADAQWNYTVTPDGSFTVGAAPPPPPPAPAGSHHRCAWMFSHESGLVNDFVANASFFDAIHPVWYALQPDGVNIRTVSGEGNATVIAAAKKAGTALIPTVASVDDVSITRTLLYSPSNRAAHIRKLVDLAISKGYVGLDLDYEHLWNNADAAPIAAFIQEFSAAMHAAGKMADFAAPALSGSSSVWNYVQLAANLDSVHLMGYDYHTIGTHAGPTAPLGWIEAVNTWVEKTGRPEKFVLGIPNYGVTQSSMCALADCAARCTSSVQTNSTHMQNCSYGAFQVAERILNCNTNQGALFFDDVASLEAKVQSARRHKLAGISYWQLGGEPAGLFEMIRRYF